MNTVAAKDIRAWLTSTGAPLEMRTAKVMAREGLSTDQGRFYIDPDDPASIREIDVVATCYTPVRAGGASGTLQMTAVMECKHAPTPWVLYRPQHSQLGTRPFTQRLASIHGERWLSLLADHERIFDTPLWHVEDGPGYALATSNVIARKPEEESVGERRDQRKRDSVPDLAFKAVYAATKAAAALATEASEARSPTIVVLFPVIVVSGQLFEAFLEGEDLVVNEIDRGKLLWTHPLADSGRILIDIVTERALPQFADHFSGAGRAAMALGNEQAQAVLQERQPKVALPRRIR